MKKQSPLSASELRGAFRESCAKTRDDLDKNGTAQVLQHLSQTVRDLKDAEVNVDITVKFGPVSNGYDMIFAAFPGGSAQIEAHGYITSGETSRLFVIASLLNEQPACQVLLSDMNVADNSPLTYKSSQQFDFNKDPKALQGLQQAIVEICAGRAAIMENDLGGAFEKAPSARKPSGGFTL